MVKPIIEAEWRKLLFVNYEVNKEILQTYVPYNTEADDFNGKYFLSLVGFMFLSTTFMGLKVPFHHKFEEVNLRLYVRRKEKGVWKHGVVFIKEFVGKPAITFVANTFFYENYLTVPMAHYLNDEPQAINKGEATGIQTAEYQWKWKKWNTMKIIAGSELNKIIAGSETEFLTERYWGFTKKRERKTLEYVVEHPRWEIYQTRAYNIAVDFGETFGKEFGFLDEQEADSVFFVEGSGVKIIWN